MVQSTISGTVANQATMWEAPIDPFSNVTIADPNSGATDTLTITVGGTGGTLDGSGLSGGTNGVYTLSGTDSQVTAELDALAFTPMGGGVDTTSISTFKLSDVNSADTTPTVDTKTSVVDADAPNFWSLSHSVDSPAGKIYAIYEGLLGRAPDEFGYEDWMAQLAGGESLTAIVRGFLGSPEYTADFGKKTSNHTFIENLYETALHRPADQGGLQSYEDALANGVSRATVALDIMLSPEAKSDLQPTFDQGVLAPDAKVSLFGSFVQNFSSVEGKVYALYQGLLGRSPQPLEFEHGIANIEGGESLDSAAHKLLSSAEFTADFGNYKKLSNTQFIDDIYQTALHRQPDAGGLQSYKNALSSGTSRQQVALDIALSPEAEADLSPSLDQGVFAPSPTDSDIARLYYGLLGGAPHASALKHSEASLASGTSLTTIAQDLLSSPKYQAVNGAPSNSQFLTDLYQDALGRAPDAAGFQSWSAALSSGMSRASVALGISESPEAQQHLAANIEVGMKLA